MISCKLLFKTLLGQETKLYIAEDGSERKCHNLNYFLSWPPKTNFQLFNLLSITFWRIEDSKPIKLLQEVLNRKKENKRKESGSKREKFPWRLMWNLRTFVRRRKIKENAKSRTNSLGFLFYEFKISEFYFSEHDWWSRSSKKFSLIS